MLIEFSTTNYRSIHETQRLSMVAANDNSHELTNCMPSGISAIPQLVRTAILYGANARGKSNLISALTFMRSMIETSAAGIRERQTLNVSPFLFDPETTSHLNLRLSLLIMDYLINMDLHLMLLVSSGNGSSLM